MKTTRIVCGMNTYRVLNEQCDVTENKAVPKAPEDISSDSLQNPSDPDAAYSGHKGQGFQAQIMETYSENKDGTVPNPITHVEVEPAHVSDAHALIPALGSVRERDMMPDEILADTLYGSDENIQKASEMKVEIISPVSGGNNIVSCPQGYHPVKTRKRKGRYGASFNSQICRNCPMKESCTAKHGKKFHYANKDIRISKRREYEQTTEFKDRYRYRSGIEATMSQYDSQQRIVIICR